MTYLVNTSPEALDDLDQIVAYIAQDKPSVAIDYALALIAKIQTLEENPKRCPVILESRIMDYEIRHLIFHPYRILYRIEEKNVTVLRILHSARKLD